MKSPQCSCANFFHFSRHFFETQRKLFVGTQRNFKSDRECSQWCHEDIVKQDFRMENVTIERQFRVIMYQYCATDKRTKTNLIQNVEILFIGVTSQDQLL